MIEELKILGIPKENWPKRPFRAEKYHNEYNYQEVKVNEPVADEIFEFDPTRKET